MKKLLMLLLLIPIACMGQIKEKPLPAIYLSHQPFDLGFGIRGDYHPVNWVGFYGSASYGTLGLYKLAGLKNHIKATLGFLIPVQDMESHRSYVSLGINYHHVEERPGADLSQTNNMILEPLSFELGVTIYFTRFALAVRTDVLRWEPCIDIGIPIGKRNMRSLVNRVCCYPGIH